MPRKPFVVYAWQLHGNQLNYDRNSRAQLAPLFSFFSLLRPSIPLSCSYTPSLNVFDLLSARCKLVDINRIRSLGRPSSLSPHQNTRHVIQYPSPDAPASSTWRLHQHAGAAEPS